MPYVRHNLMAFDPEKRDAMISVLNTVNDSGDDVEETLSRTSKVVRELQG